MNARNLQSSRFISCSLFILLGYILCVATAFPRSSIARSTSTAATLWSSRTTSTKLRLSDHHHDQKSWVEFEDPETGCQVILLGCLHGSPSSAADVEHLFPGTDVLVLELCEARFSGLSRDLDISLQKMMKKELHSKNNKPETIALEWSQFVRMVTIFAEKGGWSTGLAAAVLGGMSGMQTALTGMTPGLEFRTGLALARAASSSSSLEQQQQQQQHKPCDVILADQDVSETLRRIGQLPQVSLGLLREWISTGLFSWKQSSLAQEARTLHTAIWGNPNVPSSYQLQMIKVLTRNQAVIQDVIRVSVPSMILGYLVLLIVANVVPQPLDDLASTSPSSLVDAMDDVISTGGIMVAQAVTNILVLALAYIGVLLPATRVVLSERDEQLCRGIRAACRVALSERKQQNDSDDDNQRGRVVAVLGLLHVNGVAQRLLQPAASGRE